MNGSFWSLLPPIIAILLALLTKEVYISLLIGILTGAMLFHSGNPLLAADTTFSILGEKVGSHVDILIFLVLLGIIVALISKSGASLAYGNWASKKVHTKKQALLATTCLGAFIFVDDYFNCLTVGTVMRPVTDRQKISRAKLAYVIDATAAPVCILAPISSWGAAVSSSLPAGSSIDGFSLFLRTIPFNYYALYTLIFMLFIIFSGRDAFKMKQVEQSGDNIESTIAHDEFEIVGHGGVIDLILPILILIVSCVGFMLYTGGFFSGASLTDAFANCDAARSLVLGSFFSTIFIFIMYGVRKTLSFVELCNSFTEGFKAMAPSILILCFAWTLSGICGVEYLNLQGYVLRLLENMTSLYAFLPCIFFVTALGLSFSTGTSWGTFGILIPIAASIFPDSYTMVVLSVAAILAGSVCGDHISPISDTTILASTGAQCNHIQHVSTQLPYALCVAICSIVGFLVAGIFQSGVAGLFAGAVVLVGVLVFLYAKGART